MNFDDYDGEREPEDDFDALIRDAYAQVEDEDE